MSIMDKEIWQLLQEKNLTKGEYLDSELDLSPWYIKTMQGFAGWIAALFMLAFVGTLFGSLFFNDNEIILGVGGLGCCIAAFLIFRSNKHANFFEQLALATSMCGQFMLAWSLFDIFSLRDTNAFLLLACFQGVLAIVMPNFLHRVLSTWFAMVALFWGLNQYGIFGLDSAIAAALFTLIWIKESSWYKFHSLLIPVSFGLAISLVQFSGHFLFRNELADLLIYENPSQFQYYSPIIGNALLALTCIYLVISILKEQNIKLSSQSSILSIVGMTILLAASTPIAGLSSAILILMVGFLRQRITLIALGITALISFISWYYYNLVDTLLVKSIYLMSLGSLLLLTLWGLRCLTRRAAPKATVTTNVKKMSGRKWLTVVAISIVVTCININILNKETIIRDGRTVALELAPVDPRSLMQGDYMQLRYQLDNEVRNKASEQKITDGYALVELNNHDVAKFIQLETDLLTLEKQLKPNQLLIQFRLRDRKLKFATNAFFFEEGTAQKYEEARYGEFKVDSNGEMLLIALRDKDHVVIGKNTP